MSFQTTLKLNPCHVAALCNFGALLHHARQYQESESMYLKALSIENNCCQAWCNLGALQALRKDFANAERSYKAAMSIDPIHETTLYNYGILKAEQRQVEAAEGMLMR
jgi:Tfp pilus assembly protein PilF